MDLPDHKIPDGFDWTYYRVAKENILEAVADGEYFTVVVYDEKSWDSDQSGKRNQEQVSILLINIRSVRKLLTQFLNQLNHVSWHIYIKNHFPKKR